MPEVVAEQSLELPHPPLLAAVDLDRGCHLVVTEREHLEHTQDEELFFQMMTNRAAGSFISLSAHASRKESPQLITVTVQVNARAPQC